MLRMLINGKKYCMPRSKHIEAKFFLAKDYHNKGEIEFAKCRTQKMWVDILTKPKQGTPFRRDRSMLMNVDIDYDNKFEQKTPTLASYRILTKRSHVYRFLIQSRRLNDPGHPIAAGVCWDPP